MRGWYDRFEDVSAAIVIGTVAIGFCTVSVAIVIHLVGWILSG